MARITYVKKSKASKKGPRRCYRCGEEIKVGEPYKWFANRIGRSSQRKNYHEACKIRRSEQTTSAQLGVIYDAQETAEEALASLGDFEDKSELESILEAFAESVREAAEMYGESADNIEEGFGHSTYVSEEIREKQEALDGWADDIDAAQYDLDEFDADAARQDAEQEAEDESAEGEEPEEGRADDIYEEKAAEWRQEQVDKVESVIGEMPI